MSIVAIPAWTAGGVLPPIDIALPTSAERSPYVVSLVDWVHRFGSSPERRAVIDGLLRYRAALHAAGLLSGFQWLDGSFLEHVEQIENRAPNDIDVVTFYRLPAGTSQTQIISVAGNLFDHGAVKIHYRVDAYLVHLGKPPERLVRESSYWYSLWSHRRNQVWKGFLQIDLADAEDVAATAALASLAPTGATP